MNKEQKNENPMLPAIVAHFKRKYPELADLMVYCPRATRTTGNINTFGASDLILLYPTNGYSSLCVHVLSYTERFSEKQNQWRAIAEHVGNKCVKVRNLIAFDEAVEDYLSNSPYA